MIDERLLQWVERPVLCQSFDRRDARAIFHHRQCQTCEDPPAIDQYGASAALTLVAALLGAGQVEMIAQCVEKGRPRVEIERMRYTVHGQIDRHVISSMRRGIG